MNDDIASLFDRAALDIRPGFKQELRELLVDVETDHDPPFSANWSEPLVFVAEPTPQDRRPDWRRVALSAAAAIAFIAGLALIVRSRTENEQVPNAPTGLSACDAAAAQLGVVHTQSIDVRVGIMPDGQSFCLVDNDDGSPLGSDLVIDTRAGPSPSEPGVVDVGAVSPGISWYLLEIPDAMPVASVTSGGPLASFPTRVGRRLLVIDATVEPGASDGERRELNLVSDAGAVLATVVVDPTAVTPDRDPP